MSTAKQLISAFVDAPPLYWDRSYVQNMREIRGYPNWWRIRDDVAYIDGPPNEGEQYTRDLYVWSVEIVKDEDTGANTNKLELYDLDNTLEQTTEVVNGETIYRWKYQEQEPELTYEHTDVIDSVSLEFDQLGRKMIAFESAGDVFLIWYDTQQGQIVTTNFGAGKTPNIVTDTYRRIYGSADSERLLFYVDSTTNQIVYRKQLDRFGVAYQLPDAPNNILEILKVSKNIYGGLTVIYCYEDNGNIVTGSFTARAGLDKLHIGTDNNVLSKTKFDYETSYISNFVLKVSAITSEVVDFSAYQTEDANVSFTLRDIRRDLNEQTSQSVMGYPQTSSIKDFTLEFVPPPEVFLPNVFDQASYNLTTSSSISTFKLKEILINISIDDTFTAEYSVASGDITNFSLG